MSVDPVSLLLGGGLAAVVGFAVLATVAVCLPLLLGLVYVLGAAFAQLTCRAASRVQVALATAPNE